MFKFGFSALHIFTRFCPVSRSIWLFSRVHHARRNIFDLTPPPRSQLMGDPLHRSVLAFVLVNIGIMLHNGIRMAAISIMIEVGSLFDNPLLAGRSMFFFSGVFYRTSLRLWSRLTTGACLLVAKACRCCLYSFIPWASFCFLLFVFKHVPGFNLFHNDVYFFTKEVSEVIFFAAKPREVQLVRFTCISCIK